LLDDPVLAARLGTAGKERALQLFKWQKFAADVAHHYRAALARRRAPKTDAVAN
jgi:hypothetical protein